ncbi:MAG: pyrimidine 5'-nucleotidase [Caulobacter sp.]|nr:pyrimidine 5'-nucleotidase [Caulobacter sp.]
MTDLTHIDTWLFDLDNTLYPVESEVMTLVAGRMTDFMEKITGLPRDQARAIQKRYYEEHGTTLAGLMANNHGVDPEDFLTTVHDISLDALSPDPALLAGLQRLPGRRLVFTNGSAAHAVRVLERMEIAHAFEDIFHIAAADYIPKPARSTFEKMMTLHAVGAEGAAFFEDSEKNLAPAAELGMTTVLVGPHAAASTAAFINHRTNDLAAFLNGARVRGSDA